MAPSLLYAILDIRHGLDDPPGAMGSNDLFQGSRDHSEMDRAVDSRLGAPKRTVVASAAAAAVESIATKLCNQPLFRFIDNLLDHA